MHSIVFGGIFNHIYTHRINITFFSFSVKTHISDLCASSLDNEEGNAKKFLKHFILLLIWDALNDICVFGR